MKPDEQRMAIAEWCGWRVAFPEHEDPHPETKRAGILLPYKWVNEITHKRSMETPDYLNDLNAMHEAEKRLGCEEHKVFRDTLYMLVSDSPYDRAELAISSTAAQRAEALLRTIGKWHDSTLHTKG